MKKEIKDVFTGNVLNINSVTGEFNTIVIEPKASTIREIKNELDMILCPSCKANDIQSMLDGVTNLMGYVELRGTYDVEFEEYYLHVAQI
jgi:hypothetical protein